MGGSKLRAFGDPYSANVVLPKQLLIDTIKSAVGTNAGPGVDDRQALAERMMTALDEGYEGFGWRVFDSGRAIAAELKATLARSLLEYLNDPSMPPSGDESCRRVWLVAAGAGVPRGAGSDRPIRTADVAPTVARILGFKMTDCEGKALAELT